MLLALGIVLQTTLLTHFAHRRAGGADCLASSRTAISGVFGAGLIAAIFGATFSIGLQLLQSRTGLTMVFLATAFAQLADVVLFAPLILATA
ncbi:MAG: hypothetical protein EXR76_15630 [Myxococcales bacterium]|nr:hypothetical protein [Myxococcales bacterium]